MTEALFELLSLECRVDTDVTIRYYNALGELHRVYGPAVERTDGYRAWWQNDQLHRVDGPAVIRADGRHDWYQNGQRHRLDGPAVECPDGSKFWYQNGLLHRLDGPAIERPDGYRAWHINDRKLTQALWRQEVASMETV